MTTDLAPLLSVVAAGLGATAAMDAWNLLLRRAFGVPSLNMCHLGRWIAHVASGRFVHDNIALSSPRRRECATGWAGHYAIGAVLAVGLHMATRGAWFAEPTLSGALLYGMLTVAFPMLVLQPAIGLGIASGRTARPGLARLKSVATHLVYGLGLYGWASVLVRW